MPKPQSRMLHSSGQSRFASSLKLPKKVLTRRQLACRLARHHCLLSKSSLVAHFSAICLSAYDTPPNPRPGTCNSITSPNFPGAAALGWLGTGGRLLAARRRCTHRRRCLLVLPGSHSCSDLVAKHLLHQLGGLPLESLLFGAFLVELASGTFLDRRTQLVAVRYLTKLFHQAGRSRTRRGFFPARGSNPQSIRLLSASGVVYPGPPPMLQRGFSEEIPLLDTSDTLLKYQCHTYSRADARER